MPTTKGTAVPTELLDDLLVEALRRGQTVRFRNLSDSMLPVMRPHDLVIASGEPPAIGDIAVAWRDRKWLTHRVVAIGDDFVEVRADNGGQCERFARRQILGRVESIQRDLTARLRRLRDLLAMIKPANWRR